MMGDWQMLFAHDDDGRTVQGSILQLASAASAGWDIRVAYYATSTGVTAPVKWIRSLTNIAVTMDQGAHGWHGPTLVSGILAGPPDTGVWLPPKESPSD